MMAKPLEKRTRTKTRRTAIFGEDLSEKRGKGEEVRPGSQHAVPPTDVMGKSKLFQEKKREV